MRWYEVKEQAAGEKRLILLWYIYKIFGKTAVKFLVFFITFFAFLNAKDIRKFSAKYLEIVGLKPTLTNQFKHFLSYSYSLVDKMESFANRFDPSKIVYENSEFTDDLNNGKGLFLICSHLGNIEVLRSLLNQNSTRNPKVNIFLSGDQCKIFNSFIRKIAVKTDIETYPVEEIGIDTSIEIKEKLNNGEIVFMAGDRLSQNGSASFEFDFLGKKAKFPKGTFKFAKLMEVPAYFIAALNEGSKYHLYIEKAPLDEKAMREKYVKFLEQLTQKYPLQFYHFYDFFE